MAGSLAVDSSSTDFVISMCKSSDFPGDKLLEELSRVLKPGGEIFFHHTCVAAAAKETVMHLISILKQSHDGWS